MVGTYPYCSAYRIYSRIHTNDRSFIVHIKLTLMVARDFFFCSNQLLCCCGSCLCHCRFPMCSDTHTHALTQILFRHSYEMHDFLRHAAIPHNIVCYIFSPPKPASAHTDTHTQHTAAYDAGGDYTLMPCTWASQELEATAKPPMNKYMYAKFSRVTYLFVSRILSFHGVA